MPKTKTRSAARKRFKTTAKGRILRRPTMRSHNLEKKSSKRKRKFRREVEAAPSDRRTLRKLLGVR